MSWGDEDLRLYPARDDSGGFCPRRYSLCSQDHGFGYGPQLQGLQPSSGHTALCLPNRASCALVNSGTD